MNEVLFSSHTQCNHSKIMCENLNPIIYIYIIILYISVVEHV